MLGLSLAAWLNCYQLITVVWKTSQAKSRSSCKRFLVKEVSTISSLTEAAVINELQGRGERISFKNQVGREPMRPFSVHIKPQLSREPDEYHDNESTLAASKTKEIFRNIHIVFSFKIFRSISKIVINLLM